MLGAADPDVVWHPDAEEVVTSIDTEHGTEPVFEVVLIMIRVRWRVDRERWYSHDEQLPN